MKHRFTAPLLAVLVLALAAFTGSALAGDNHGSGSGDSGKAANQDKQSSTSASQPATGGSNAQGVKPSNTTKHDTHAAASSDQTKKYGNGQTAGQIATKAGHGDAILHGPGNSQPHKTAACPGGHEVDVHALKNKDSKCGSSQETKQVESAKIDVEKSKKTDVDVEKSKTDVDVEKSKTDVDVQKTEAPATLAPATVAPATTAAGAVLGTQATITPAASSPTTATPAVAGGVKGAVVALKPTKTKPAGGVLGTTTRLGGSIASTRLPFTGLPLWIFALVAAGLIGIGLTMRRVSLRRI